MPSWHGAQLKKSTGTTLPFFTFIFVMYASIEIVLFLLEQHLKMKQVVVSHLVHIVVVQVHLMKTGNGLVNLHV